ncbi:MAG: MMPL family transporter [Verrucomicrobiota bacterium]|jgi:predicted RND superfamily exporter protein/lauroyl/myristoyl acyltransferase
MNRHWFRWWWLLFLVPIAAGLARLHFDTDVLDLLPAHLPAVTGLKIYQEHFTRTRELVVTVKAPDADSADSAARSIAESLRRQTSLVSDVIWQPPWLEHPEQMAELIGYLWLNQPPEKFRQLAGRLAETNLAAVLAETREQLATTMSPTDLAQLGYDPFGLTRLPESVAGAAPGLGNGQQIFASPDGKFRILFVEARGDLTNYRQSTDWLNAIKQIVSAAAPATNGVAVGYTGRPAFVAEISAGMKHDIGFSVGGTSVIIAALFWIAHRRWRPMLWLLTLLALILAATLALGGLIFGAVNVLSMGFAAILLGLAVDYALVHYQEALARPELTIPEIRHDIAPAIFWAAVTTISAFLVLNFGGLPGLAQLGTLVGIGVALSACVMIFAFLPPLFPQRMRPRSATVGRVTPCAPPSLAQAGMRGKIVFIITAILLVACAAILFSGLPRLDSTADALQPRNSPATVALNAVEANLSQQHDSVWLIVAGHSESDVAQKLDAIQALLEQAVSNRTLSGFASPAALWPRPVSQAANRAAAEQLVRERDALHAAALAGGFAENALGLADGVLDTWRRATASTNVFWPANPLCSWMLSKLAVRTTNQCFAASFLYPAAKNVSLAPLAAQMPRDGVWMSSWERLGQTVLDAVTANMWKVLLPMVGLVFLSLWLAFRQPVEILLSLAVLTVSGICLLAVMKLFGWSWNLLNLMALPLILGTGVDYSIFMQLALRRYGGDQRMAHRAVGRALLLCGGTAMSGFGSLGFSSNAGMASLGRVCAVGIACNMLISVFLLPNWWRIFRSNFIRLYQAPASAAEQWVKATNGQSSSPSSLYGPRLWQMGLLLARFLPASICTALARCAGALYWLLAPHRRKIVRDNLLPVFGGDRALTTRSTRALFAEFALKLADLWRYESGVTSSDLTRNWSGWEHFTAAQARGRGVLFVTPHLGNWELGGAFLVRHGYQLLVLTQAEPDQKLTALRQASRARWGVETLVVGEDAFAFVEIIKRLQAGATVALLVDRPPPPTAVTVDLFGRPFLASIAVAELARASGCAILPGYIVREDGGYLARILPEITYDRAAIATRAQRLKLTQEILRAFEPAIRQHAAQWYHFVPIWPEKDRS